MNATSSATERRIIIANCRQACQYNTLGGCKVKEYNAICPLTNMVTPITEYKMTNADRIRAMSDEELAKIIERELGCTATGDCEKMYRDCNSCWLDWLQQPAE